MMGAMMTPLAIILGAVIIRWAIQDAAMRRL